MPIQRRGAISKNISIGLCRKMPIISSTLILLHFLTIVREWHFGKMPLLRAISCKQRHGAQQLVSYIYRVAPPRALMPGGCILHAVGANLRIVRKRQYHGDNNELVELSVLR